MRRDDLSYKPWRNNGGILRLRKRVAGRRAEEKTRGHFAQNDNGQCKGLFRAEEGVEGGSELGAGPILRADDFAGDAGVAADEVGFGNHHGAVVGANFSAVISIGGKVYLMFAKKFLIGGGVVIPAYANHRSTLGRNALLKSV